jgi:diaminopimelate epimerase
VVMVLGVFAKFVYDHEYTKKTEFSVETRAGIMLARVELLKSEVVTVSVDMGEPVFDRASIPISRMDGPTPAVDEPILVDEELIYGTALKLGNPHFVIVVDDVWAVQLNQVGPKLENHPLFPKKANIEFIKIKSSNCLEMRVWERGSGVTLACGTGACGSVVAATLKGLVNRGTEVEVVLPGGILSVQWKDDNHVWQTGPATSVYRGSFFCHN